MKLFYFFICIFISAGVCCQVVPAKVQLRNYSKEVNRKGDSLRQMFAAIRSGVKMKPVFKPAVLKQSPTSLKSTSNCGYLCSVNCINTIDSARAVTNPICKNATTNLIAYGVTGTNPVINWYSGRGGTGNLLGTGDTLHNAGAGKYYVIVSGSCGSSVEDSVTVSAYPGVSDTTVAICNRFFWNGVEYKLSGDYADTLTNAFGCDSIANLHLTILSVSSTFSKTDAGCYASSTGSLIVTPTSGVAPYTYRLGTTGSFGSTNSFQNLRAGNYRVAIRDSTGCAGLTAPIMIGQLARVTATFSVTDAGCFGTATGAISISPANGQSPYTYRLGTAGSFVNTDTFRNLKSGNYRAYVKDFNGCTSNFPVRVNQLPAVEVDYTTVPPTCTTPKGSITLSVAGSSRPPYTYRIGTAGAFTSVNTYNNLRPGTYRGYAKDSMGCVGAAGAIVLPAPTNCGPSIAAARGVNGGSATASGIVLWPNPTATGFSVSVNNLFTGPVELRVLDVSGKVLHSAKGFTGQSFHFGDNFIAGLYLVEVRYAGTVSTIKAVKVGR